MTAGFCCVLLVATCLSIAIANDEFDFDKWLDKYSYAAESVNYETWKANMDFVVSHNERHASFDVTLNKFAHLAPKDLVKEVEVGEHPHKHHSTEDNLAFANDPLPEAVDWRSKGVVTPVRDQGQVDPSYAFTAADAISSFVAIHTGKLTVGSANEIVDCCHYHPCSGRFPENAFKCVHGIGGLCSTDTYKNSGMCVCDNSTCSPFGTVQGGKTVPKDNESALAYAVVMQPIQVAVDASHSSFQLYQSGIYDDPECSTTGIDHTMLLVGYGTTDEGQAYWILKNSWGVNWGLDGYMLMARNKGNMCGVATDANYPY